MHVFLRDVRSGVSLLGRPAREPKSEPGQMKLSKGQSQPEKAANIRLCISLHGSGSTILIPGFDCDSKVEGSAVPMDSALRFKSLRPSTVIAATWQGSLPEFLDLRFENTSCVSNAKIGLVSMLSHPELL